MVQLTAWLFLRSRPDESSTPLLMTCTHRLVSIQSSISKLRIGNPDCMRKAARNLRHRAVPVSAQHKRRRAGDKGSTERCAPARRISSPGIGSHDTLAGSSQPHRRRTIVREYRLDVLIRGRRYIDNRWQGARINLDLLAVVAC